MNSRFIFIIIIFALLIITGCSNKDSINEQEILQEPTQSETKATGSTETGDVLIELTPHAINNGKLEVDIGVNTHSVDLAQFDLNEITTLSFNGKELKPISAPSLTGHHSSGILLFDIGSNIESYAIIITGVPLIEERIFTFGD